MEEEKPTCACPFGFVHSEDDDKTCLEVATHACDTFGCSHACYLKVDKPTCACPRNWDLVDDKNCEEKSVDPDDSFVTQHVTKDTFLRGTQWKDARNNYCASKPYTETKEGQHIKMQPCEEGKKGQKWEFDADTGLISCSGSSYGGYEAYGATNYCVQSQLNDSGDEITSGRNVIISECDEDNEWQQFEWDFDLAVIRLKNGQGCLYWDEDDSRFIKTMHLCKMLNWGIANQDVDE